ncbi:hypothetical protein KI387_011616 [Taxus chinensis]|uniref:Uncharacterized protein n=1 Tax=Taxus chinensis TaxID=29808 RepID=A0AA38CP65_TAXCH|nr:hypothetical protein KI387_011616 [Taxus chinensis]
MEEKQSNRKDNKKEPKLNKIDRTVAYKEEREDVVQDSKYLYSPTSTPLLWSSELYVKELMNMKERLGILENQKLKENSERKELTEVRYKLERENKILKEQVLNLQNLMERGQQELTMIKQDLGHMKTGGEKRTEMVNEKETIQIDEIQSAIKDMEIKENQLKDRIEEAKTWSQLVSGSSNEQRQVMEKHIKTQIKEEKDQQNRAINFIIKGLKDFGENERTDILARDFLKDELKWTGYIQQANRIGRRTEGGKDRHVRVVMRKIEDKHAILKNRGLLRGTHIYLDEDLTFAQQEDRRKEWEKVRKAREAGKWAQMRNGKAQISDHLSNRK